MISNPLQDLQKYFNPSTGKGIRVGVIVSKYSNRVIVKNAYGNAILNIFGTYGNLGDTVLYKDNQLLSVIKSETLKVVEIL